VRCGKKAALFIKNSAQLLFAFLMFWASYPQEAGFLSCFLSCLFLFIGLQPTAGLAYRGVILPFFGLALPFFGLLCLFSGYSAFFRVVLP
jgi:hypothetical protein